MKNIIDFFLFESDEFYKSHTFREMERFEVEGKYQQISMPDSDIKKLKKLIFSQIWEFLNVKMNGLLFGINQIEIHLMNLV